MSFLNKNFNQKPSLAKPALVVVAVLLLVGGAYTFLGTKKSQEAEKPADSVAEAANKINPSGLDEGKDVDDVKDVEEVIAKWIEANPQAIIASVANMQKKAMEEQVKNAQKNIGEKKNELFNDKSSPQFSSGDYDITIVEFFDYSCGYCKRAQATVEELLKQDKKVRIIFKEFPILGQQSHEMSEVAIAVNMVDPAAYKKFHDALMKGSERGKAGALKAAKAVGVNMAKLESTLSGSKDKIAATIQANLVLGSSIGVNGTPGFVIGEELIPGALELSAMKEKISAARKTK